MSAETVAAAKEYLLRAAPFDLTEAIIDDLKSEDVVRRITAGTIVAGAVGTARGELLTQSAAAESSAMLTALAIEWAEAHLANRSVR